MPSLAIANLLLGSLAATSVSVSAIALPDVSTAYPYTGPAVPIGDWVDPTINGNGKGFPRLVEPPAVVPGAAKPTNNVNVVSTAYLPHGVNIHFQTPFGLGQAPSVRWGTSPASLTNVTTGQTSTYDRTPPCSLVTMTQCSQFFHNVQLTGLAGGTTYYYQILPANGTTASQTMSVKTARPVTDHSEFSVAVLNDMGYTNAKGTHQQLINAVADGVSFAWHGGDISYADQWYAGVLPCESSEAVCYNGTSTTLPGPAPVPAEYLDNPLPAGEFPTQGGPWGGDMSVLYESNWDLWQQWMNNITTKVPYMVLPGNHEATCSEFDGPGNVMTAYLNNNETNSTAPTSQLTYFSCPPSQRNFTAYQHRFRMPGAETGGVSNYWYSFDSGLAHFISIDTETDFYKSPEYPFVADLSGNETFPMENETYVTDSGPFGYINGSYKDNKNYEQYNWLAADLAAVNRTATPWVVINGHRPMYSSQVSGYQANVRNAFEALMLQHGVDAYFAGHIHWYERLLPLGANGTINAAAVVDNHTYTTDPGVSMTHLVNGMAGNVESHSTLSATQKVLNITAVLNMVDYGFSRLTFKNASVATWEFIHGADGSVGDSLTLIKKTGTATAKATAAASSSATASGKSATGATAVTATSKSSGISSSAVAAAASSKSASSAPKSGSASASAATTSKQSSAAATAKSNGASASASAATSAASTKSSSTAKPASAIESGHGRPQDHQSWEAPAPTDRPESPGFWSGWDSPAAWSGYEHGPEASNSAGAW